VYKVGVLSGFNYIAGITDAFKAEMTELGYVEGENIIYDVQKTDFDMEAYKSIAKKFVEDDVDLIFVYPTEAAMEAKMATEGTDIPVLFDFAFTEGVDLVDDLLEPGGNITGARYPGPDVALRRYEILRELAPDATRIWVPFQAGYPPVPAQLEVLYPAAEAEGVELIEFPANNADEIEAELDKLAESEDIGIDAILTLAEPVSATPDLVYVMAKFAAEHKIPIGGALMEVDGYGTIFGVNADIAAAGKQAAPLADKILKGTPAGSIPVLSLESFLQINYTTAQELGVEVPESLLEQANEVIR
jgi:putative ABC transport system substrate-binding protein